MTACNKSIHSVFTDEFLNKPVDIVFPPGFKIALDGKAVPIFGDDLCSTNSPLMNAMFGSSYIDGESVCLVVTSKTQSLPVKMVVDKKIIEENWKVVHTAPNTFSLQRESGQFVVSYDQYKQTISDDD